MKKVRISCDVNWKLRQRVDAQAKEHGISRAKFIEDAVESKVEGFNVHKENKRLTEARRKAELEINMLHEKITTFEKQIAAQKDTCNRLEHEKTQLTEQRDEFEKLLHDETDTCNKYDERVKSLKKERDTFKENLKQIASHLGVPDTVEHCKQRIDELQESIENKKKERDCFKAKSEEAESNYRVCRDKVDLLLQRNWWERLWNKMPWMNERLWDKPSRPITPTPDTKIQLPTDETIE